jgi:hypothetical protein
LEWGVFIRNYRGMFLSYLRNLRLNLFTSKKEMQVLNNLTILAGGREGLIQKGDGMNLNEKDGLDVKEGQRVK